MRPALRRLLLPLTAALLVLAGLAVPAHAAPDVWTKWNRGDVWIRSLDYIGTTMVAGSEESGVFTKDGAGSWVDVSGDLPPLGRQVHQAVGQSGKIYLATTEGLFKGGGGAWSQLGISEGTPVTRRLNQGGVQSVAFPTGDPSYLVAATAGSSRDGVFFSSDSGTTWNRAGGLVSGTYHLTTSPTAMYAAASTGFWRSTDQGRSWSLISDGIPPGESARRIAVSPLDPLHLVAATGGGVYRSANGGLTWTSANGSGSGLLNVTDVRAFLLVPAAYWHDGLPRIVVGADNGVWATQDGGATWGRLSATKAGAPDDEVSMAGESVYALGLGFGTPGTLVAGTQGHGVFSLPLQAASAPSTIPAPSGHPVENHTLTAAHGTWGGTAPFAYAYRWRRCDQSSVMDLAGATCEAITGATSRSYVVTAADVGSHLRVGVRARSVAQPSFSAEKLSQSVGPVTGAPGAVPTPPSGYPRLVGANVSAPWGTTYTLDPSGDPLDRWLANGSYAPTTYTYRWLRCRPDLTGCQQLEADDASYTTTVDDVDHVVQARVVGTIAGTASPERLAGVSGRVYERTPQAIVPPRVVGRAWIGHRLQSSAGVWTGTSPTFTRRWLRCDEDGAACVPLNPPVTTSSYLVKPADRGATFRVEVTARVTDASATRSATATSAASTRATDAPPPPACVPLIKAVDAAGKAVSAAQKALRAAKKTGVKVRIAKASRALAKAKERLAAARKLLRAAGC